MLACRLIGKAWPTHRSIVIACADQQQCNTVDEQLWMTPDNRFIAHSIESSNTEDKTTPILITADINHQPKTNSVLVDLRNHASLSQHCQQYVRILDIVTNNDDARNLARQRYKSYRQMTAELHTHEMS